MTPIVRPATAEDVERFHPGGLGFSVRGWAFELDGKPIGLGGIAYRPDEVGGPYFFADTTPELERFPKVMIRTARAFLAKANVPASVFADPTKPMAEKLMGRLGFVFLGRSAEGIAAFRWGGVA